MKSLLYKGSLFVIAGSLLLSPTNASMASTQSGSAFDPSFLISDEELQDYQSMNRADIQAFLKDQSGTLHELLIEDKDGKTRTAADIIYRAALEHNINPKYLLVKLQKEQSLITDSNPTEKQLDGATGYGITDGCGWSCDMYIRNKGFGKQVDSAAGIMRWYYDNMSKNSWIKRAGVTYTIDGASVTPASDATGFLYTYTPHLQGNENFWKLWQLWFEQVYPNGTLVKTATEPTVYLIKDGKRHAFESLTALTTRFDPKRIITIPSTELLRYDVGTAISLPNYSLLKEGTSYYLLDNDTIRQFEDADTVRELGYNPDEIISVTAADLAGLTQGKIISSNNDSFIGQIIRKKGTDTLYYYKDNILHPITDPQIASVNFPNQKPRVIDTAELDNPTLGESLLFADGTLILVPGSNHVYVIEHGKKRHIVSEEVFTGLGYKWGNIITTNVLTGMLHPTGQPLYLRQQASAKPDNTIVADKPINTQTTTEDELRWEEIKAKMIRTPSINTQIIGEPFTTDIDSYLVMDVASGDILLGKNIDSVRPLASLTKVFTAHRLMKEELSLSAVTAYDPKDHKSIYHRFRVAPGEKIFNRDLLDAMLVSSLNTPVRMLVDAVEENEATFIANMNAEAKTLGATHTLFTGVTGELETTVSTAREYATLFLTAIKNKDVQDHLAKKSYRYTEFKDLDGNPDHADTHTNELLQETNLPYTIIASKTGYLYESGADLAMLIERPSDKKQFLLITLGNVDYHNQFAEPARLAKHVIQTQ